MRKLKSMHTQLLEDRLPSPSLSTTSSDHETPRDSVGCFRVTILGAAAVAVSVAVPLRREDMTEGAVPRKDALNIFRDAFLLSSSPYIQGTQLNHGDVYVSLFHALCSRCAPHFWPL